MTHVHLWDLMESMKYLFLRSTRAKSNSGKQNKSDYKKSLKENYDLFIKDAKELNTLTKGAIDLFKTGQDKITALNLFDKYSKFIPNPDKINQIEAEWISDATTGSIIFARPYTGPGHYKDVK